MYYTQGFQRIGYELKFCTYHYIIVAEFAVFQRYIHTDKSKATPHFFRRDCFGSCRTEYASNGSQIF